MGTTGLDGLDAAACPLLGLAADPRSHYMYPHPVHRCYATDHPATTDAGRQAMYCLDAAYRVCDRYTSRQRRIAESEAGGGSLKRRLLRRSG